MIHEDFYQLWRENKNLKEKLHIEKQNNKINQQYLDQYDHIVDKYLKLQKKHQKASNMIAGLKKDHYQLNNKYLDKINEYKQLQLELNTYKYNLQGLPHVNSETLKTPTKPISWTKSIIPNPDDTRHIQTRRKKQ